MKTPHYLLFADAESQEQFGRWRFVLEPVTGGEPLQVDDVEAGVLGERVELLSVIRGLEALDQPSRVTLVTPSRYVRRGLRFGLENWRENRWRWERHGQMVPVKNRDLWQRLDQALQVHKVNVRYWRWDSEHDSDTTYEADYYSTSMPTAIPA